MSWDKNTINTSSLNEVKSTLDDLGVEYKLTVRGEVPGHGNNDDKPISLRQLEYGKYVLVEQLNRSEDCDFDDYIVSLKFLAADLPKNFPLEVM